MVSVIESCLGNNDQFATPDLVTGTVGTTLRWTLSNMTQQSDGRAAIDALVALSLLLSLACGLTGGLDYAKREKMYFSMEVQQP